MNETNTPETPYVQAPSDKTKDERMWAMITHLSGFAMYISGIGHIIGPLIVWLIKRDSSPFVDDQGKEALNFQISFSIYMLGAFLLFITVIGAIIAIPLFFVLPIAQIILMIVAAIKANEGVAYRYPAIIRFIK
jgi:uncharacterized Tic20 family protein